MRIALVTSVTPFVDSTDRTVVDEIALALGSAGHRADVVRLPFADRRSTILRQLSAFRTLDLTDLADAAICFDSPAHLIQHPRKIVWYLSRSSAIGPATNAELWDSVRRADSAARAEASRIFVGSETVSELLQESDQVGSDVLSWRGRQGQASEWMAAAERLLS